jgi:hypothetical protein
MTMRLIADGNGNVAVYDYTIPNDNPYSNPLGDVSRLRFHSTLRYPGVVNTVSMNVTLNAAPAAQRHVRTAIPLFAHGRGGIPFVEGKIISGLSRVIALCGSVPVQQVYVAGPNINFDNAFPRVVHLGADSTNVYLNDYYSTYQTTGFPALTLGLEIYVTDVNL